MLTIQFSGKYGRTRGSRHVFIGLVLEWQLSWIGFIMIHIQKSIQNEIVDFNMSKGRDES